MVVVDKDKLKLHVDKGHEIELVWYGEWNHPNPEVWGVALECNNCHEILADIDIEGEKDD